MNKNFNNHKIIVKKNLNIILYIIIIIIKLHSNKNDIQEKIFYNYKRNLSKTGVKEFTTSNSKIISSIYKDFSNKDDNSEYSNSLLLYLPENILITLYLNTQLKYTFVAINIETNKIITKKTFEDKFYSSSINLNHDSIYNSNSINFSYLRENEIVYFYNSCDFDEIEKFNFNLSSCLLRAKFIKYINDTFTISLNYFHLNDKLVTASPIEVENTILKNYTIYTKFIASKYICKPFNHIIVASYIQVK